ncbi:hypothetical protein M422DRAFT_247258 [Sphaerobolus stellatus SS14]|nr:hypothetical protein M422DRAFT_247258 [Sphaerobolus stellatus SS14]
MRLRYVLRRLRRVRSDVLRRIATRSRMKREMEEVARAGPSNCARPGPSNAAEEGSITAKEASTSTRPALSNPPSLPACVSLDIPLILTTPSSLVSLSHKLTIARIKSTITTAPPMQDDATRRGLKPRANVLAVKFSGKGKAKEVDILAVVGNGDLVVAKGLHEKRRPLSPLTTA